MPRPRYVTPISFMRNDEALKKHYKERAEALSRGECPPILPDGLACDKNGTIYDISVRKLEKMRVL